MSVWSNSDKKDLVVAITNACQRILDGNNPYANAYVMLLHRGDEIVNSATNSDKLSEGFEEKLLSKVTVEFSHSESKAPLRLVVSLQHPLKLVSNQTNTVSIGFESTIPNTSYKNTPTSAKSNENFENTLQNLIIAQLNALAATLKHEKETSSKPLMKEIEGLKEQIQELKAQQENNHSAPSVGGGRDSTNLLTPLPAAFGG